MSSELQYTGPIMLLFLTVQLPVVITEPAQVQGQKPSPGAIQLSSTDSPEALIGRYRKLARADGELDWQEIIRPITHNLNPEQWTTLLSAMEAMQTQYALTPASSGCERWTAWQLARCRLELAAGRYAEAVARHLTLLNQSVGCVDEQQLWWSLASSYHQRLRDNRQYGAEAALLEAMEPTFPAGPARQMRAEIARLRYRLGILQWYSTITGVLGDVAELGGIDSHWRAFITAEGQTRTLFLDSSVVITRSNEVWDPEVGFVPISEDSQSPVKPTNWPEDPLVSGRPATAYLDSSGNVVRIDLGVHGGGD